MRCLYGEWIYSQLLATAAAHRRIQGGDVAATAKLPLPTPLIPVPLPLRFPLVLLRAPLLLLLLLPRRSGVFVAQVQGFLSGSASSVKGEVQYGKRVSYA